MTSLTKLDTSASTLRSPTRPASININDSDQSARSSVISISDSVSDFSRASYPSTIESFSRASSFSRTSLEIEPESVDNTPVDLTGASLETTINQSRGPSKKRFKDGAAALTALGDVRNVICVAFGAFDRYYLSWEDNDGKFHQGTSLIYSTRL